MSVSRLFSSLFSSQRSYATRQVISTNKGVAALAPYSQAIRSDNLLFVSGQLGMCPEKNVLVCDKDVEKQTHQAIKNLEVILKAGGSNLENVLKTTVFLADMADFEKVNKVYAQYFPRDPPARSCVAVKTLPRNALFEIECIARVI